MISLLQSARPGGSDSHIWICISICNVWVLDLFVFGYLDLLCFEFVFVFGFVSILDLKPTLKLA